MRGTIHVVSRRDYWPFAVAIRAPQRDWWLRVRSRARRSRSRAQAEELRALMADGPRRHDELVEVAAGTGGWSAPWVELVRVPPSGTWEKRRAHLFQTAERWVGPEDVEVAPALDQLVRRYLGAFGPASRGDIALWSGIEPGDIAPALERLALRRFRDESGGELLDVPGRRSPPPRRRRRCASCPPGTPCSSSTRGGRVSCPKNIGRGSSPRRRPSRSRPSSSTVPSPAPGGSTPAASTGSRSTASTPHPARGRRRSRAACAPPRVTTQCLRDRARHAGTRPRSRRTDAHSEEWRAVLMGDISSLKYFRAVLGKVPAGPRCKLVRHRSRRREV